MALPPLTAATEDVPQPDPGVDAPGDGGEQGGDVVFATIMKTPDGKFVLLDGDEPEGEADAMVPGGGVDGPQLLKQLMAKIEGDNGEEAAMAEGFAQGSNPSPAPPAKRPMPSMAA